jgi:hypothetical protein
MLTQLNEAQLGELSITELEEILDGKKAKLVILNDKREGIVAELALIDEKLEELTGLSPLNLARSEAMKASWEKRKQNAKVPYGKVSKPRSGSLLTVLLSILGQTGVNMSLDTLAEEVLAAGWRGRGGKVPKDLKGSIYGTIYAYRKSGGNGIVYISYDKATKTYSI